MSRQVPPQLEPISLRRLFPSASFVGCADIPVTHATEKSAACEPKSLFAAVPGSQTHGIEFLPEALKNGAKAVLTDTPCATSPVPQCIVKNVRAAYAHLCEALYDNPSHKLHTVGITGTNGKTTSTFLTRSILTAAGHPTGLLGTIEYHDGHSAVPSSMTTPDSEIMAEWLARMVHQGTTHATLELSSHALHQSRASGTRLDVAVITNITQDHFDYHQTFEDYVQAKSLILQQLKPGGTLVLNADDPHALALAERAPGISITCGFHPDADLSAEILEESALGTRFRVDVSGRTCEWHTPLLGRHNVSNSLCAAAACIALGVSLEDVAMGIAAQTCVPGRLQRVTPTLRFGTTALPSIAGLLPQVYVDYAHTADALHHSLQTLKRLKPGRLICVFGAGGDRDRSKRPHLAAAAESADIVVVTSDNPRTENPAQIAQEVLQGFASRHSCERHVELDRMSAIRFAIESAGQSDCVLIAGKGHERTQTIGDATLPFDDYQIAADTLMSLCQPTPSRRAA